MVEHGGWAYILASKNNSTIYVGVTSDIVLRILRHRESYYENSFTSRYSVFKLVYYEFLDTIGEAIEREKQLKNWRRKWKTDLIETNNLEWEDLFNQLLQELDIDPNDLKED